MLSPQEQARALEKLATEAPEGTMMWRRATGQRAVLVGWIIKANDSPMMLLDLGPNIALEFGRFTAWSATKVDPEAEDWQEPEPV